MLIKNNLLHLPVSIVLVIKYYYRQAHYHVHKPLFQKRLRSSTTKKLDPETVYYYKARYLDPKTSRWLGVDPAMSEYVDPDGKWVNIVIGAAVGANIPVIEIKP